MKACAPLLPLLALSALTACAPSVRVESRASDRLVGPTQIISSSDELSLPRRSGTLVYPQQVFGQWRLVALTGVKVAGHRSIHMLIGDAYAGDGSVEAISQCLRLGFRVGLQGPGMIFAAASAREVLPGDQLLGREIRPSPGCRRGLDRVEKAFSKLLQSPGIIEGRPGGRIAFVGRAGEALLERPNEVAADLYQHMPWQTWGEWHVQSMTLGNQAVPIRPKSINVLFKTSRIEAQASCKSWRLPYRQEGDRLTIYARQSPGGCERDDFHDERAFSRIMAGDLKIAHSSPTARLVVGRAGSIRLVRRWLGPTRN